VPTLQEGLEIAQARHGKDAAIAAVPRGPYVLTRCRA